MLRSVFQLFDATCNCRVTFARKGCQVPELIHFSPNKIKIMTSIKGVEVRNIGRFPFTKKFGNFLLGISVWEKRVPFVISPILGRPGRLIDRERHGTGDKTINL